MPGAGSPAGLSAGIHSRREPPGKHLMDGLPPPESATAAALARLYDLDLADDPGDLELYLALAARAAGPVLELAVGTGRVAVPLAAAGHQVTGVDRDPAMLERARSAAAEEGDGVAARLELVEADLVDLRLPSAGQFGLAFIALNSLLLLDSRAAQRAAILTLAAHLAPGGLAVVDVWIPAPDDLVRFDGRISLEYLRAEAGGDRFVTKVASADHDPIGQTVRLTTIYEEGRAGEPAARWARVDRLRLISVEELTAFAEEAGLRIETVAGGYDLEPIGPGGDRAVLVAELS